MWLLYRNVNITTLDLFVSLCYFLHHYVYAMSSLRITIQLEFILYYIKLRNYYIVKDTFYAMPSLIITIYLFTRIKDYSKTYSFLSFELP